MSQLNVRKIFTGTELVCRDGEREVVPPLTTAYAAAVIRSPWAGQGYVEDLWPVMKESTARLAVMLSHHLAAAMGGEDRIEAFGKAAIVGINGESEHGAAILHGPWFGPVFRHEVGGTSPIPFVDTRGTPGMSVSVPLYHKTAQATRSHYQCVTVTVPDAPHPDEMVIALVASSGGRPHPRIGDKTTDPQVDLASVADEARSSLER